MLKKIGEDSVITSDPAEISEAKKLILPGVGTFDSGVSKLKELGIWTVLNEKVQVEKTPILGICLGAQLMTASSEEGVLGGFGWVEGSTVKFRIGQSSRHKIPNMGWAEVTQQKESKLFQGMQPLPKFYFVHSYHFSFADPAPVLATSEYCYNFASAFEDKNVVGVQFHPEKSHKFGMHLLSNFSKNY